MTLVADRELYKGPPEGTFEIQTLSIGVTAMLTNHYVIILTFKFYCVNKKVMPKCYLRHADCINSTLSNAANNQYG